MISACNSAGYTGSGPIARSADGTTLRYGIEELWSILAGGSRRKAPGGGDRGHLIAHGQPQERQLSGAGE